MKSDFYDDICALRSALPGKSAVCALNLETGEALDWDGGDSYPAASMIKLPILCTAFDCADRGILSLDDRVTLPGGPRAGGDGVLRYMQPGLSPTLRDIMTLMIVLSDNYATNLVVDAVTPERINAFIDERGLDGLRWRRKMMDGAAMAAGIENEISASGVTALLKGLANGTLLSPESCGEAIDILLRQQVNHKLPRRLWRPYDGELERAKLRIAHKTGDMPGLEHDSGIFYGSSFSFVLTVLTVGERIPEQSVKQWEFIGAVAERFVDYWKPDPLA